MLLIIMSWIVSMQLFRRLRTTAASHGRPAGSAGAEPQTSRAGGSLAVCMPHRIARARRLSRPRRPACACLLTVPSSLTTIASLARTRLRHLITSHQLAVRRTCRSQSQTVRMPSCSLSATVEVCLPRRIRCIT